MALIFFHLKTTCISFHELKETCLNLPRYIWIFFIAYFSCELSFYRSYLSLISCFCFQTREREQVRRLSYNPSLLLLHFDCLEIKGKKKKGEKETAQLRKEKQQSLACQTPSYTAYFCNRSIVSKILHLNLEQKHPPSM